MNLLLLALALATPYRAPLQEPYQDLTLDDKGTYSYVLALENSNDWGPWILTENGEFEAEPGEWVRFLNNSWYGWLDVVLKVQNDGTLARTRHNDETFRLDKIWQNGDTYRSGYYQVSKTPPIGAWNNEVWPKAAITLRTNNSDIYVHVTGSPSESVVLIGDNNSLHVYALPGVQSRLMQDRPTVQIKGNGNRLSGYIQSQMTGVFVNGNDNHLIDLTVVIGPDAVGDDVGGVCFYGRNQSGNRATRTHVISFGRAFPATHGWQGFYFDSRHEGGALNDCTVSGFMRGVFGHGVTNTKVDGFLSINNETPILFVPYFETPDVAPVGNSVSRLTRIGGR